jgi:hypothetical protein
MMYADDEKRLEEAQSEFNTLLERRVSALEERVAKVEVNQAEDHEEIVSMRYDMRFVKNYIIEDQRGWRWLQTFVVVTGLVFTFGVIWFLI